MKLPQFVIGITIMFWGWQTGLWLVAIPMALIYEAAYFVPWRWELTNKEFMEVGKFCGLILVGILLYLVTANRSVYWIFEFFQWFPVIFFPFVAAQAYGTSDRLDIRMFFYFLRNRQAIAVNLTYPFFALCIISASAGNLRGITFYLGMFSLCAIALWFQRSSRFSPQVWFALIILAGGMGILGHLALHRLHRVVENKATEFLSGIFYHHHHHHYDDPTERTTAIGDIGSVKLGNEILFRVKPDPEELANLRQKSFLLRRVIYNKYQAGTWIGLNSEFVPIASNSNKNNWDLVTEIEDISPNTSNLTISTSLIPGQNFLNLPQGTSQIIELPGDLMAKNQYGTVKIEGKSGLASYQVRYSSDIALDSNPTNADLQIPIQEQAAIANIVDELNLRVKSPTQIIKEINKFFNTEFTYSLDLAFQGNNATALSAFLLDHRSGHCEYFSTAAALLLREVGIPTRYVVGYSVHEYSPWENQFIVRERNSHAWDLAYINGQWQEFDPTPSSWIAIEDANSYQFALIQDLWSLAKFKLAFVILQIKSGKAIYLYLLLIIPLGIILWRQFNIREGIKRITLNKKSSKDLSFGKDSELYLIETALKDSGIIRESTETWFDWLRKLEKEQQISAELLNNLQIILQLHYRYRFDPQGINKVERNQLQSMTQSWLVKYENTNLE